MAERSWVEIAVHTSHEAADIVAALLIAKGAEGAAIDDPRFLIDKAQQLGSDLIDEPWSAPAPQLLPPAAASVVVKAYLPPVQAAAFDLAALATQVKALAHTGVDPGRGDIVTKMVAEEDWADSWKQFYKPLRIGRRLMVVPSWEDSPAAPGDVVITLDPGMAFGTGTHPTTQMCLAALEEMITPGCKVCDVGTGSGILAIAAALLGAREVLAVDVDENAVAIAAVNAEVNKVSAQVAFRLGSMEEAPLGGCDILMANIVASIIIKMLPLVPARLSPGGMFIASGIVEQRLPEVLAAWRQAGLNVRAIHRNAEWACIVGG